MATAYRQRIVDRELAERLAATGAVLIEGPRSCGKTMTARQTAASEALLDVDEYYREAVEIDPALVLDGPTPRLIDEWQVEPRIWNRIRRAVDDRGRPGQFILTGSASPSDDITRHTGAGRITRLRMRPMSLLELGRSTGTISLGRLFDDSAERSPDPGLSTKDIVEEIVAGGWPGLRSGPVEQLQRAVQDYLQEVTRMDISGLEDIPRHDPLRVARLLRSLARNTATQASVATLARDTQSDEQAPLTNHTVSNYLDALQRTMVTEDQPAWSVHLRSSHALRVKPKRHFADPSLAAAALRASPETLMRDLNLLGLLFESLVVRDLRVYAQANDGLVLHYRDSAGREVDAIIEMGDGRWGAFEVKLGAGRVDEAAESLKRLTRVVDTSRCGSPAVLGVIVGQGIGYRRPDGVQVIPIGTLGP